MRNRRSIVMLSFASLVIILLWGVSLMWTEEYFVGVRDHVPFSLDAAEVDSIIITGYNQSETRPLTIVRSPDLRWQLATPIVAEADEPTVMHLVDMLFFTRVGDALSAHEMASLGRDYGEFGLAPEAAIRCRVEVRSGTRRECLAFGSITPSGEDVYVRKEHEAGVFTLSTNVLACVMRNVEAYRRRALFSVKAENLREVDIRLPQKPAVKLLRGDDAIWRLTEPIPAAINRVYLNDLLDRLLSARIMRRERGDGKLVTEASADVLSVTLRDAFDTAETILFSPAAEEALVSATMLGAKDVFKVSASLVNFCREVVPRLRDRRIFTRDMDEIKAISFTTPQFSYSFACETNHGWQMVSPARMNLDESLLAALLEHVRQLRTDEIIAADDPQALSIAVRFAETNMPSVVVSLATFGAESAFVNICSKKVFNLDIPNVSRITVRMAEGETILVPDDAHKAWSLVGRANENSAKVLDEKAVAAFIEALRSITAVSVESVITPPEDMRLFGLTTPTCTIVVDYRMGETLRHNVLLGNAGPGGGRFICVGGSDAVFTITRKVATDLMANLVK